MSINLATDTLLTFSQACRFLPRKPSPTTLWRWRTKGVQVNGQCIKLECVRVGARWMTTQAAMIEFIERQTAAASPIDEPDPEERSEAKTRKLQEAGLL